MTDLRNKIKLYLENKGDFPLSDIEIFLNKVVLERGSPKKVYNPLDTETKTKPGAKRKNDLPAQESISDFIATDLFINGKLEYIYLITTSEEHFLYTLADYYAMQFLYRNSDYRKAPSTKIWNEIWDVLDRFDDFNNFKKSKKKNLTIWGLSTWDDKKEIIKQTDYIINHIVWNIPNYDDLIIRQKPDAKKESQFFWKKDLREILRDTFENIDCKIMFSDLVIAFKKSIGIYENKFIPYFDDTQKKDSEIIEDEENDFLEIDEDKKYSTKVEIQENPIIYDKYKGETTDEFDLKEYNHILSWIKKLSKTDKIILELVIEGYSSTEIERYFKERKDIFVKSMGRSKVDYRLEKVLKPKIQQFLNSDQKELNNVSNVIKIILSKLKE